MKQIILIMVVCLFAGCQPRPQIAPPTVSPAENLEQLRQLSLQFHSLSALADVRVSQQGKRWSTTQGLLVERPLRLRVDAINFFGQMLFQMAVDGPRLQAYVPSENQYYSGVATMDHVQRFTGLPLSVADLVAGLLYSLPPGVMESGDVVPRAGGMDFIMAPGVRYEVTFDAGKWHRLRYCIDDYILYEILYSQWGDDGFPRQLELTVDSSQTRVVIQLEDVELNSPFEADKFQLTIPEQAQLMPLDEMEPVDGNASHD
nr:DUF4292 domain-containing protein [uncultured Desulfuromonas sp.]